jgi:hypothetical protein
MILTDEERNSGKYFIKETDTFVIEDGITFNLSDEIEATKWEAIKNCSLIAPERFAKDSSGNYLIDGTTGRNSLHPRYGIAELYIDRPGVEAVKRVSKKKKVHNAVSFILDDDRGTEGRLLMAKVLGKHMDNMPDADVEDYLISIAEKDPDKIISLYTGDDMKLRILFIDAKDKGVIVVKSKIYIYNENTILGATDDAVISWMKDPKNKKVLELIKRDTYPDLYSNDDSSESSQK